MIPTNFAARGAAAAIVLLQRAHEMRPAAWASIQRIERHRRRLHALNQLLSCHANRAQLCTRLQQEARIAAAMVSVQL